MFNILIILLEIVWIHLRHNYIQLFLTTPKQNNSVSTSPSLPNNDDIDWLFKNTKICPGQCGSGGWSIAPWTEGWQVWFLVRAHAWADGSVPVEMHPKRQQSIYLSHMTFLSLSLLLSLKSLGMSSGKDKKIIFKKTKFYSLPPD